MRNEIIQYGTVIRQNKVYAYKEKVYKIHSRWDNQYGENEYFIAQQIKLSKYTKYFVKYHRLIEEGDYYILEMESCLGDLNNFYDNFLCRIPPSDREYYIFQILKEVLKIYKCFTKLFSQKFIFRDLTLNNILYDSGRIKLCDFEMIKLINQNEELTTDFNQIHEYYLEDEQNEQYDESIDIHSLGVCLYKLYRGPQEDIVYEDGRVKLPLGVKPSLRLFELLDSMLTINPQQRVTWDQLFKYIYKETIRVQDITQTFELNYCQQFNYFDFRFIIQQLIYRHEAFNETASQTRQFQTINLFMDEFCNKVNKIFLDIADNDDSDKDALLFLHFRMMTFRIQQLQIQAEKFDDEIDRFDIIEQLNEPTYLYQMFAQLIAYFQTDTIEKLIKNEDKMIQDYYRSHKGEQAEYFHFLEIMKQLYS